MRHVMHRVVTHPLWHLAWWFYAVFWLTICVPGTALRIADLPRAPWWDVLVATWSIVNVLLLVWCAVSTSRAFLATTRRVR